MMQRGQSTLEYTVVVVCLAAALVVMQGYIKRGIQGKLRATVDDIGQQYDPANTTSNITVTVTKDVITSIVVDENDDGDITKTTTYEIIDIDREERTGNEQVGSL